MIHVSNFRPVKRIDAVMQVFARICREVSARLLLVGDGPETGNGVPPGPRAGTDEQGGYARARRRRSSRILSIADVFLLPSAQESFGLAALEAMACEVPVVASRVGGLPEVIEHGVTGFLHAPADLDGMARSAIALLTDARLHQRVAEVACQRCA